MFAHETISLVLQVFRFLVGIFYESSFISNSLVSSCAKLTVVALERVSANVL